MPDAKKRRKIIAICVWFALLGSVLFFLITSVSFSITGLLRGCISITLFEKQKLHSVDKVVLTDERTHRVATITDTDLISEIIKETAVATHANLGCAKSNSRRIDLFSGDELIRSMKWSNCCENTINVYNTDSTHWIRFPVFTRSPDQSKHEGWVVIPQRLVNELNVLLAET